MSYTKTRFTSSERHSLILRGYINPSGLWTVLPLTVQDNDNLRKKGKVACSRFDAILSRRRELGLV